MNTFQIDSVLDEQNVCDWSKLDAIVAGFAKSFSATSSAFGTFDFDAAASSSAVQKERRVRRKADPVAEKRPTAVTEAEAGASESGRSKVEIVHNTIKEVIELYFQIYFCTNR